MGRVGFIQDKLEIKFLILYVAARLIEPVPFEAMQELTMCDDGIDFFDFSECLSNLVESQHLTLSDDGLYAITEKGLHNGAICESSLPYSVRLRADKNITIFNQKLKRRAQIQSDIAPRRNGTYTVTLAFNDDESQPILKMELMVPRTYQYAKKRQPNGCLFFASILAFLLLRLMQQFFDRDAVELRERAEIRRAGVGRAVLPLADRLTADAERLGDELLRHLFFRPVRLERFAERAADGLLLLAHVFGLDVLSQRLDEQHEEVDDRAVDRKRDWE